MEYSEEKVIEFMRLYGGVLENKAILFYGKDLPLRQRAAIDLKRALSQYKEIVPRNFFKGARILTLQEINGLEEACNQLIK